MCQQEESYRVLCKWMLCVIIVKVTKAFVIEISMHPMQRIKYTYSTAAQADSNV